jgi:hypothetical protein
MMADNVVDFPGETTADFPPDKVLNGAIEAGLESVVIVGLSKETGLYTAASSGNTEHAIFLLEFAKHRLLRVLDERID